MVQISEEVHFDREVQEKVTDNSQSQDFSYAAKQNENCITSMKHLEDRYHELPVLCDKSQTAGARQPKTV